MIVKINNLESGLQKWCILECQGENVGDVAGNALVSIKVKADSAELEIGAYTLEGQIVTLKQPYLIIGKEKQMTSPTASAQESSSINNNDFDMVGLVYKKIHFKTRPKPKPIQFATK